MALPRHTPISRFINNNKEIGVWRRKLRKLFKRRDLDRRQLGRERRLSSWKPLVSEVLRLSMARFSRAASGGRRPLTASKFRKFMLP
jgi:hypothetical protein